MIHVLDTHMYILILERCMNNMFGIYWSKDVIYVIVNMINDEHVDVCCNSFFTTILKNGNVYICTSCYDTHNYLNRKPQYSSAVKLCIKMC